MSEGYIYPDPHPPARSATGRAFGLASHSKMVTLAADVPVFDQEHDRVGKTSGQAQVHNTESRRERFRAGTIDSVVSLPQRRRIAGISVLGLILGIASLSSGCTQPAQGQTTLASPTGEFE